MEVLRFSANIPEEVALKYDDGKEVEGRYGNQVLYTLTDERLMYLPPIAAKRISDMRIARGELFQVCKKEVTRGQKRTIEWQVTRVDAPGDASQVCTDPMPSNPRNDTRAGTDRSRENSQPGAATGAVSPAAAPHQAHANNLNNSNGTTKLAVINGNPQAQAAETALVAKVQVATQLADALKTAIAAAGAAEEFAKSINYSVRFSSEDIRTMANTLLIGKQKEQFGGYR